MLRRRLPQPSTAAVSLVITTPDHPGQMLLGVRTPTATSRRHPNVLSTPTMRVPEVFLMALLGEAFGSDLSLPATGDIDELPPSHSMMFGGAQALATGVAFLVEATLARKVGVADALVQGNLFGRARPLALAVDRVPDAATGQEELTCMLTVGVELDAGAALIPEASPSYSEFLWVDTAKLREALDYNDVFRVAPDVDLMVCIYGLCVRSAAQIVDSGREEVGEA